MLLDYTSLLLAVGFSGAALSITLLVTWWSSRAETFLLTWAIGITLIVAGVPLFGVYSGQGGAWLACAAFVFFTAGLGTIHSAAYQFRRRRSPTRIALIWTAVAVVLFLIPFALGYDALAFMVFNTAAALMLFATARQYLKTRAEAPTAIIGLVVLYAATGISFLLCTMMLAREGSLVLEAPPMNWAENLNVIVAIIGITGVGAISLALHQTRMALRHRADARTDPLTGLLNRRALYDIFGTKDVPPGTAVLVLDLDHFKAVNDRYGHGVGDDVLKLFAEIVLLNIRSTDVAARHGGEEFCLILPGQTPEAALELAETIRNRFGAEPIDTPEGPLFSTVSGGMCFVDQPGHSFSSVLQRADQALYLAKRGGRNRISVERSRLAA
jgi:diguanylate cyclase (GGDEF)-like protein